ncbi:hypothetical protein DM860_004913 [Cuscuta australis]|uniref:PB1 domain-containing protein n=1 Tax=Cuscuta australis TaxID=267555 RepID=A0A328DLZ7_9ASTE|nr:hypothetical protein DM860_004913 [Cuscuta australis]
MESQKSVNSSSSGGGGGGDGEASKCKVKLMCSYGGKIHQRQRDNQLAYVGGDTKILTVDRRIRFPEIFSKLSSLCTCGDNGELSIKYQLPGEDLDALVSLIDDDDVEHMMVEYDRMLRVSAKPARLRLFLFNPNRPVKPESEAPLNPDFLFGFDKDYQPSIAPTTHDLLQLHIPGMPLPENPCPKQQVENGLPPGNYGSVANNNKLMILQSHHHLPPHLQGLPESHVTGGVGGYANGLKMVYGLPVLPGGYHPGNLGQFSVIAGGGDQNLQHPIYSFVQAVPSVPVPEHKQQPPPPLVSTTSGGEMLNPAVGVIDQTLA